MSCTPDIPEPGPAFNPSGARSSTPSNASSSASSSAPSTEAWAEAACSWPQLLAGGAHLLAVKDAGEGRYLAAGPAAQVLFGLDPAQWVGRTDAELFGARLGTAWRAADQLALGRADPVLSEHAFEWREQWREFVVTRQAVPGPGGTLRVLSHWTDVRAQRQQARHLEETLAALQEARAELDALRRNRAESDEWRELRDPVSGLPGPQPFLEQLRREADLSAREGREMALILLEIEPLAAAGELGPGGLLEAAALDLAARAVGGWLRAGTRTMDATARLGPTRFGILLSGAGLSIAARRAEAIRAAHVPAAGPADGAPEGSQPNAADFRLSLGVASYPLSADTPDALMHAAEQAVQRACARGGNQVALAGLSLDALG